MTIEKTPIALALILIAGAASGTATAGSGGHGMDGHDKGGHMTQGAGPGHGMDDGAMRMSSDAMQDGMNAGMTQGEVVAVDREKRRLTLKHEHIDSHDMPGMTMPFPVGADVDMDAVKPGDQVRFSLKPGTMMIDKLEPPR